MSESRRSRYSRSPSSRSASVSYSRSRSNSRSRSYDSSDVENPGNNLYVTGLSSRVTKEELERHFESEGKVTDVHLVMDPWTRESRGFGFVTMATVEEAHRCIKYLNRSVLEDRVITVEKAKRRRGRTPTPGRYLGVRSRRDGRRSLSGSPYYRSRYSSSERERSYSPSPYYGRRRYRSRSPAGRRRRYRRSHSRDSRSPSYSRSSSRSPDDYYYSRRLSRRQRSSSRSVSPRRRSYSPKRRRYISKSKRSPSRYRRGYSRESYSHSRSSMSRSSDSRSRSVSRSP